MHDGEQNELHDDEPPPLDQIPKRHEQEQANRIAELRRGGNKPGAARVIERVFDHAEHRLIVIDVGNSDAAGSGHRKEKPLADRCHGTSGLSDLHVTHTKSIDTGSQLKLVTPGRLNERIRSFLSTNDMAICR